MEIPQDWGWRAQRRRGRMGAMPGPLDPLELALLLEAAGDVSGLDRDETAPVDEADDGDEDDREPGGAAASPLHQTDPACLRSRRPQGRVSDGAACGRPQPRQVLARAAPEFVMPADWRSLRPKGLPQSSRRRDKDTVTWFVDGED